LNLPLHWKILIGLALGVGTGLLLNAYGASIREALAATGAAGTLLADAAVNLNQLLGDIFKRGLQFIAVPIILFAMVLAVGSLGDVRKLGKIGLKTGLLFFITGFIGVGIGLVLVNAIQPGGSRFISAEARAKLLETAAQGPGGNLVTTAKSIRLWDLARDAVPTNPFDALARGDMLQVVVLALAAGIALSLLPRERSAPVYAAVQGLSDAFILIVRGLMHCAPVGVFCLVCPIVANLGFSVLSALGAYCVTVLVGLALIQFVVYPAVVILFSRVPLGTFFKGIAPVQLVAFSSSSSAATLPVTIQCVRDRLGMPADVTSFVCAMGAKFNMDGTALMQAVATVFLAQFYAIELSVPQQLSLVITAVFSAIGSPGIPSGGMVMLVILLRSMGIPAEGIAMILAVDRVLDMCRTVVNVTGDAACCVAVVGKGQPAAAPGPIPPANKAS
jgi:Na+/H+-dicarboxylate symporter